LELNRLAEALLTHETLNRQEIEAACRGETVSKAQIRSNTGNSEPIKAKSRGIKILYSE
jgi:hypothetical protein